MQALAPHVEHDVIVTVTPRPETPVSHCSTLDRIIYLLRHAATARHRNLRLIWWFMRNFHRYDTIHARVHADWYFVTYLIARLAGRRLVLSATLDDSVPKVVRSYREKFRGLALWLFQLFDAYVSISPKLQREMESAVAPSKCHLIPCGIEMPEPDRANALQVRQRLNIPSDSLVLVYVGGIVRRKDPLFLVRNLPALLKTRPDTFLLLVGPELDPGYANLIRAQVRADDTTDHVIFVGEVTDPHPYFDAADIMVFASTSEGLGTAVPEAMAHGLPVLVRHLPEVNDFFVLDGETGFFFRDDAEYVHTLIRLALDPELRMRVGRAARDLVRTKFDMRQVARRYLQVYGVSGITDPPLSESRSEPAWHELMAVPNSTSIVNQRFHTPAYSDRAQRPMLLTVIDAEESFDWRSPCSPLMTDVTSMGAQHIAHRIFERHGVVPIYAVDYPVTAQDAGRRPLQELLESGSCEVGTQLHAWVTPPFLEDLTPINTYPGNLPLWLELEKIRNMTNSIQEAFCTTPRFYRAGRYGVGRRTGDIIKHLGYKVDASIMPRWNFGRSGGPDFSMISAIPFWADADRTLLEIPGSAALVGHLADAPVWLTRSVFTGTVERTGLPAALARTNLLERIRLSPEGFSLAEAKRLVRHMLSHRHRVFLLSYHSPSLVPGNTPYVRTADDLKKFLEWLDEFYCFFFEELGGHPVGWRNVWSSLRSAHPPACQTSEPLFETTAPVGE
jgi:glycosyltransferase involved in cell wall biosynthesis